MDKLVKVWNVSDDETEGTSGRKREISLATSRDLGVVSVLSYSMVDYTLSVLVLNHIGQSIHRALVTRCGIPIDPRCSWVQSDTTNLGRRF